jgi:mannose-6-phosphate isomerase-like protein (cupin superfamily)
MDTAFRARLQSIQPFSLQGTYAHLKDTGAAVLVEVGPEFWSSIGNRSELHAGRLVCSFRMEKDMPDWEMHPAGDELLVLLSGAVDLVLQDGRNDRVVEMKAGQAFLVPFGTWHRVLVKTPGELLFITPGKGTQHRPL